MTAFTKFKNILKKSDNLRDLYGSYRIVRSWMKYTKKPPYKEAVENLKNQNFDNFTNFFTEVEIQRRNKMQSMGINLTSREKADNDGREWLKFLQCHGLNEKSTVMDYGCGSLRLGKTLIKYLNPQNYVGVDISDHFYSLGIKNYLTNEVYKQKRPEFYIINSDDYETHLSGRTFDFIYSQWVMMHVHPDQLSRYFDNIFSQMNEESVFFFDFTHSIITLRQNALTWGYPSRKIKKLIIERGFAFERVHGNMLKVYKSKR